MALQEISYQTVIDGVFPNCVATKRKCWPKFPLNLGLLTVHNSTHAAILGNVIEEMNLEEVPKRMHDPKSLLGSNFFQEHTKIAYPIKTILMIPYIEGIFIF